MKANCCKSVQVSQVSVNRFDNAPTFSQNVFNGKHEHSLQCMLHATWPVVVVVSDHEATHTSACLPQRRARTARRCLIDTPDIEWGCVNLLISEFPLDFLNNTEAVSPDKRGCGVHDASTRHCE